MIRAGRAANLLAFVRRLEEELANNAAGTRPPSSSALCRGCGEKLAVDEFDRTRCEEGRSPKDKLAQPELAIQTLGDSPEQNVDSPPNTHALVGQAYLDGGAESLTESHVETLQALMQLKATTRQTRRTAAEVAKAKDGVADAKRVKALLAYLTKWGFVDSEQGRRGGSWLTEKGERRLKDELQKR